MSLLNLTKIDHFVGPVRTANIPQTAKSKSRIIVFFAEIKVVLVSIDAKELELELSHALY